MVYSNNNKNNNMNINKWYMHNPAPVLENETHKLQWDFDIQTDHLIPARRPDFIIINNKKENLHHCLVWIIVDCEKKDEYLDLC